MPKPSDIPLRQVEMDSWSIEKIKLALKENPLLLLIKRPTNAHTNRDRRIILFVHGLNGSPTTWLPFLTQSFQAPELKGFDFGMFQYQTSVTSRFTLFQRLPKVEDWARVLANVISNIVAGQERYQSFVLVGHSMGGLVSKLCIRYLLETNKNVAMRLHSLFTYGTPHLGSDRANWLGALFSADLAFLRSSSSSIHDLQTFWNSKISSVSSQIGKQTIHERAIVSAKDYWVSLASSVSNLPEHFILRIASSHTKLHKPADTHDPRLTWFIEQLISIQKQTECSLIGIKDAPTAEDWNIDNDEDTNKLVNKFFECLFLLDVGSVDGVTKGDKFALFYDPKPVLDQNNNVVDWIEGTMNLLNAVTVKERSTYCTLVSFSYESGFDQFRIALKKMEELGIKEFDDEQMEKIFFSFFGKFARKIPRKESDDADRLEDIYSSVLNEDDKTSKDKTLRELMISSRDFQEKYPGSMLAEQAVFHEAWSVMKLARYDEAKEMFEKFVTKFPFSGSIPGARRWVEEINLRIKLQNKVDSLEAKLELAEFLSKAEKTFQEGLKLAYEVIENNSSLITRLSEKVRLMLGVLYVYGDLLHLDISDAEKIQALCTRYSQDQAFREDINKTIHEKTDAEHARLFIQLIKPIEDNAAVE